MQRALSLARQALGTTSPNPPVGAVVVKDGEVVGEGFTQPYGHAHAEIVALTNSGPRSKGGTLYTTLEPCSHHGQTPPCTDAILQSGIVKVISATADPNPRVKGNGISILQDAGIQTHVGEEEDQAKKIIEAYLKFVETGSPFVTVKFGSSLDGKIATNTGESQWITGEQSLQVAHKLRATSDAIMVGINTVLTDDSKLTSRNLSGGNQEHQPLRVVVDSRCRIPPSASMLKEPGHTLVAATNISAIDQKQAEDAGAEILQVPSENGRVDLVSLMKQLGARDITSVIVEGGGTLIGALFDKGLVDKVIAFIAPTVIGGISAPSAVMGLGIEHLIDATRLEHVEVEILGQDILISGYV
jgi:diaminohydroxyphosphoribosylaminopyrimidine deaminase/5-amino-6-(5-phosphoribosylamino)uracil reductase